MPQPRVPTAIIKARGGFLRHPERARARANEPQPTGELGPPPRHLANNEREAWVYISRIIPPGVAKNSDRIAMEEIACLLAKCRTKGKRAVKAAERQLLKSYLAEFGMTPAARSRVSATLPEKLDGDPWAEFCPPSEAFQMEAAESRFSFSKKS